MNQNIDIKRIAKSIKCPSTYVKINNNILYINDEMGEEGEGGIIGDEDVHEFQFLGRWWVQR